jgi:NDP-sugar pyrophosphorylase family protein
MTITDLFDLKHTEHGSLFDGATYGWEVLPRIAAYVEKAVADTPDGVLVGEGTVIEDGAHIKGPAIIGRNCAIRSGAYIRENAIIGDDCIVGNSTEVKNALLFNGVNVPHFNYIGDSVLGYKAHLGAGVIISNVKVPMSEIHVQMDDERIATGLEKFGALVGDGAEVGSNSVLNPGTLIGREALVYPLALVRGMVESHTILKVRQQQESVEKRA